MADPQGQSIQKEMGVGEVLGKMFEIYRADLVPFITIYLVIGVVSGLVSTVSTNLVKLPTIPTNSTSQQALNLLPGLFAAVGTLILISVIVGLFLGTIALGSAIFLTSDRLTRGEVNLGTAVRRTLSRLVSIWVLGIIVGIIVVLGFIALIVPGILLGIMFSLAIPALLIEGIGFSDAMGRSRKLVGGRWGKSFVLYLLLGIIVGIAGIVVSLIAGPFGFAGSLVSGVLGAFYMPLVPIALTVYYYSNVARLAPPPTMGPLGAPAQPGFKYCQNCGAQIPQEARFCPKCSAMQPS